MQNKISKTIKELPEDERPREKLLKYGADKLSDSELLAILLRTGTKGKSAIEMAEEILKNAGGTFRGLAGKDTDEITKTPGIKNAFVFLMTDEVQKILFWSQGGTEHPRFSENLLMGLKLPKLSEKITESIVNDVNNAYKSYLTSQSLYSQAENLLLEELGLKDFEGEDDLSYIVNLSDIKSTHRADAEYFQPKYDKLVDKLKKYGTNPLLSLIQNVGRDLTQKKKWPWLEKSRTDTWFQTDFFNLGVKIFCRKFCWF